MNAIRWLRETRNAAALAVLLLFVPPLATSCAKETSDSSARNSALRRDSSTVVHPEWSRTACIYEVNVRQYSPGGTFTEFETHLPRLKELGVDILWFMPIHPIGEKNRKGALGSYYSVKDYQAVNPEFGTLAEFKALVSRIHDMGMYVIIDWVANHTAWDNPLVTEHPEWFTRDAEGNLTPPVPDWSDVVDLDFDHPELRAFMVEAMKFWVAEADVDGFRCDVAGMVPLDFWVEARRELETVKPVFMLAEWESPKAHGEAFDMTYAWRMHGIMNATALGKNTVADIDACLRSDARAYPDDAYRMYFTTNHDENSWNGTVHERLGDGARAFAVLTCTLNGMPLIYSGQEVGLNKRLAFFEKDEIKWRAHELEDLYSTLLRLRKSDRALWNGTSGGPVVRVPTTDNRNVFAFVREKDDDKAFVALNLSPERTEVMLRGSACAGDYADAFTGREATFSQGSSLALEPWGYRVYVK